MGRSAYTKPSPRWDNRGPSGDCDVHQELGSVTDRINLTLARLEQRDYPDRARLEATLTDGYAFALRLDAECDRLERRISEYAAGLGADGGVEQARELSALARLLARRRAELDSLRGLLAVLRAGVQEAQFA
jgi:hypothetical protein